MLGSAHWEIRVAVGWWFQTELLQSTYGPPSVSLMSKARKRDELELLQVYALIRLTVRRFIADDPDSAEDVIQECIMMLLRKARQGDSWPPPPAWVNTVTSNFCRDWLSSNRPRRQAEVPLEEAHLDSIPDSKPLPDALLDKKHLRSLIVETVAAFSTNERSVIRLVALEGRSFRKAAESMGVSRSSAFRAFGLALARLRSCEAFDEWGRASSRRKAQRGTDRPIVVFQRDEDIVESLTRSLRSGPIPYLLTGMRRVSSYRKLEACARCLSGSPIVSVSLPGGQAFCLGTDVQRDSRASSRLLWNR